MITETCTCGSTFTFTAGGQHSSGDEALAAGAWRKDHLHLTPPTADELVDIREDVKVVLFMSTEMRRALITLMQESSSRGDLR